MAALVKQFFCYTLKAGLAFFTETRSWVRLQLTNFIYRSGAKTLEKISIFVDVQNIYYTCRQTYQKNFDYNKLWAEATRDRELVGAYAYATDRGDAK